MGAKRRAFRALEEDDEPPALRPRTTPSIPTPRTAHAPELDSSIYPSSGSRRLSDRWIAAVRGWYSDVTVNLPS